MTPFMGVRDLWERIRNLQKNVPILSGKIEKEISCGCKKNLEKYRYWSHSFALFSAARFFTFFFDNEYITWHISCLMMNFFFKINQLCKISPLIARKYRSTSSPQSLALQYYRRLHLLYWNFLFKGFLFHLFNNSLGWCSFSQLKILVLFIKTNTAKLLEEINPKGTPKRETRVNIFVISAAALSNFRI